MNYVTRTITGTWKTPNQQPASGELTFTASHFTKHLDDLSIMVPSLIETYLDNDGSIKIELPVTDQPSTDPIHWYWKVNEAIKGQRVRNWTFYLPTGPAVDIVDIPMINPVKPPLPVPPLIVEGPRGPRGLQGPQGIPGENGDYWVIHNRPPTSADEGEDWILWLDTNTGTIYYTG